MPTNTATKNNTASAMIEGQLMSLSTAMISHNDAHTGYGKVVLDVIRDRTLELLEELSPKAYFEAGRTLSEFMEEFRTQYEKYQAESAKTAATPAQVANAFNADDTGEFLTDQAAQKQVEQDAQSRAEFADISKPAAEPPKSVRWNDDPSNVSAFMVSLGKINEQLGVPEDDRSAWPDTLKDAGVSILADYNGEGKTLAKLYRAAVMRMLEPKEASQKPQDATPQDAQPESPAKPNGGNAAQPEPEAAKPEPVTAITVVDTKPRSVERVQPNRFWLASPQWQIGPLEMAKFVAESGMFANANTPQKALAIMFKGLELGISPMAALEHINILGDGKPPTIDSALMLPLLRKEGIDVQFIERTPERATVKMTRPDNNNTATVTWTMEQARAANLTRTWYKSSNEWKDKTTWKNFPAAMLTWRAVSEAAKIIASDIMIFGGIPMYTHEEISPDGNYDEQGAIVA